MEFGEGQVFGLNKITHLIKNTQTKKAAIIFLLLFSIAMASFPIKYQFIISAFPKKATYSRIFPCAKPP